MGKICSKNAPKSIILPDDVEKDVPEEEPISSNIIVQQPYKPLIIAETYKKDYETRLEEKTQANIGKKLFEHHVKIGETDDDFPPLETSVEDDEMRRYSHSFVSKNGKLEEGQKTLKSVKSSISIINHSQNEFAKSILRSNACRASALYNEKLKMKHEGKVVSRIRQKGLITFTNPQKTNKRNKIKSLKISKMLEDSLREHPIFNTMETGQLRSIVDSMSFKRIRKGQRVTAQGRVST